jgi:4'-phosphopantetheinyl transferase
MKTILSEYLGKPPQEIVLVYSDKGKPELGAGLTRSGLRFNLSHSRHRALLALTTHSRIGVDIEFINPEYSCDDIARRFFSPAEVHNLQALSPKQRSRAFFYCWTRKEAYIKALGEGLSQPLDSFDVAFMPGEPARLLRVEAQEDLLRWSVYDLPVPSGYAAAVVVEGREHGIFQQQWEWNRFC